MINNNLIPSLLIACGLFYVGANRNKEHETKMIHAEPVVAKTVTSSTGVGEPVIVWYGTVESQTVVNGGFSFYNILRAWSDGTIEAKKMPIDYDDCNPTLFVCDWVTISSPQMACRTDVNGNGEIEFGDVLAVLNQWGDQATCPDTVQLQCGLMEMN